MQVSATLIAAQQAAREARSRLQMPQAPAQPHPAAQAPQASFAAALGDSFSALPLKQAGAPAQAAPAPAAPANAGGRLGQHVNIVV